MRRGRSSATFRMEKKTWLVVKDKDHEEAARIFATTKVQITTQGRSLLGACLGTDEFVDNFIAEKVTELQQELHTMAKIAKNQPQASYCALVHGLSSKWLYSLPGANYPRNRRNAAAT